MVAEFDATEKLASYGVYVLGSILTFADNSSSVVVKNPPLWIKGSDYTLTSDIAERINKLWRSRSAENKKDISFDSFKPPPTKFRFKSAGTWDGTDPDQNKMPVPINLDHLTDISRLNGSELPADDLWGEIPTFKVDLRNKDVVRSMMAKTDRFRSLYGAVKFVCE